MMRRPVWLAAGVALGVTATLWAEQRVRRRLRQMSDRLRPAGLVEGARGRVRSAIDAGVDERRRREDELRRELEGPARPHPAPRVRTPGRHGRQNSPR